MRLFYSFYLIVCLTASGFSQKLLEVTDLDTEIWKESIKNQFQLRRDSIDLSRYEWKESLVKLAAFQGEYCIKNNTESHLQKSSRYKTITDRGNAQGVENAHLYEIIIRIDFKKHKFQQEKDVLAAFNALLLKNKTYVSYLSSKSNVEAGVFAKFSSDVLYTVIVIGSKPVFTADLKTPKNYYNIKTRSSDSKNVCDQCIKKLESMPKDISYDLVVREGQIYFVITNKEWFYKLFNHKMDGLAVDIVLKKQYPCDNPNVTTNSPVSNGLLLKPVFSKELYDNATTNERGNVFVSLGAVPSAWLNEDYELNVLIMQDNILCQYGTFFQIPFDDWQILDLDFDLNLSNKKGNLESTIGKNMTFIVPFEQGKSTFDSLDLKPLTDSLSLAHYNIKKIEIVAYSSVEGTKKINLDLQQKRAKSIVQAIQSYQPKNIEAQISTAENWTEFYADVQKSSKAFLATKDEDEIRNYLNTNRVEELDNILKNHRKAVINIQLERKQFYVDLNEEVILTLLNDSSFNSSDEKYHLIDEVFLRHNIALNLFLAQAVKNKLNWSPEAKTKIVINSFLLDSTQLSNSVDEVSDYLAHNSQSPMIQYNYYVLKLLEWKKMLLTVDVPKNLKQQLISNKLVEVSKLNHLRLNFSILEATHYNEQQNYGMKNESVNNLIKLLPQMNLDDDEKFRVAKFLAKNHQHTLAMKLIQDRTMVYNVHEDLLFLFINLSIIDDKIIQKSDYRAVLANASVVNKERFCTLFNSSLNGGITFQLLQNKHLKRSYCEICQ